MNLKQVKQSKLNKMIGLENVKSMGRWEGISIRANDGSTSDELNVQSMIYAMTRVT